MGVEGSLQQVADVSAIYRAGHEGAVVGGIFALAQPGDEVVVLIGIGAHLRGAHVEQMVGIGKAVGKP